jgi:ubiquinone biosynthesis protein UbiJ
MKQSIFAAIEKSLNCYLTLDPESVARMQKLIGKTVSIEMQTHLPLPILFLHFDEKNIQVLTETPEKIDIKINGTPLSLLRMSFTKDKKKFFSDDVSIEGNLELGQHVIDLFDQLEIDWEEHVSHWIGDVPAHQVGRAVRSLKDVSQRLRQSLLRNINEYVHEEVDLFPPLEAAQDFFAEVDVIRMDVDRLEARLLKLKRGVE